jgi:hypothetical protein
MHRSLARAAAPLLLALTISATAMAQGSGRGAQGGRAPLPHRSGDVLLMRDGSQKTGTLTGCGGQACLFDGTPIPRDLMGWLGLGAIPPPPQLGDPTADAIVLASGEQKAESVLGITTRDVITDAASYPRSDVRWIHLAAPSGEGTGGPPTPTPIIVATSPEETPPPATSPPGTPPPETPPPGTPPTGTPPPGGTPTPGVPSPTPSHPRRSPTPRATPPGGVVKPCPAGKPLGARVELDVQEYTEGGNRPGGCLYTTRTKLWAELAPSVAPPLSLWPRQLAAVYETTRLFYEVTSEGCTDVPGDDEACSAPGASKSGEVQIGVVSDAMYHYRGVTGYLDFSPNRPALSFLPPYEITTGPQPFVCVGLNGGGGGRGSLEYRGVPFEIEPRSDCGQDPLVFCVTPTGCYGTTDPALRNDCILHADRHAVVPFAGEESGSGQGETTHIQWNVCCGCGEKPSGPPPEITPRPPGKKKDCCEDLARARARMRGLADAAKFHEKDYEKAEAKRQQVRDGIWGAGGSLFKFSNALLGVATKGVEGAWGKILGLAAAVVSNEEDHTAVSSFGVAVEIAANPNSFGPGQQAAIQTATAAAEQTLNDTGDLAEAQRVYLEQLKEACEPMEQTQEGLEALSIGLALRDFANASQELADGLSEYADAAEDAKRTKEDWDKTLEQMDELQQEITALLACCPGGSGGAGAAAAASRRGVRTASLETAGGLRLAAAPATPPSAATVDKLRQLQAMVRATAQRAARSLLPPLAPFAIGRWRQVKPELLAGLVKAAEPTLRSILDEAEQERTTGKGFATSLTNGGQTATVGRPGAIDHRAEDRRSPAAPTVRWGTEEAPW